MNPQGEGSEQRNREETVASDVPRTPARGFPGGPMVKDSPSSAADAGSSLGARLRSHMCVRAKSLQSCLPLCDPVDCSLPGSSVHGDSPGKNTGVGCRALFQGNLPDSGIEPTSLKSSALVGRFFTTSTTWEVQDPN